MSSNTLPRTRHRRYLSRDSNASTPYALSRSQQSENGWGTWLRSISASLPAASSVFGGGSDSSIPPSPVSARGHQFSPMHDDYPSDLEGDDDPQATLSRLLDTGSSGPSSPIRSRAASPEPATSVNPNPNRTSIMSTSTIVSTECHYHLRSLQNPSHWVASLTLRSLSGYAIDDITEDDMDQTITNMMNDLESARWEQVRIPGLPQPVWKGTRKVEYTKREEEPLEGEIVVYMPRTALRGGRTGGVRITLCHKMSVDTTGDQLASGLFLRHRDPKTSNWTWMVFDGFHEHPELEPYKVLREVL